MCMDSYVSFSQLDLLTNNIPIKIPLSFCENWETDSRAYTEKQKTKKSQHNIDGEQSQRTILDFKIYIKLS